MGRILLGTSIALSLLLAAAEAPLGASPATAGEPAAAGPGPGPGPGAGPQQDRRAGGQRLARPGVGDRSGGSRGARADDERTGPPQDGEVPSSPFGLPAEREQRIWFTTADADSTEWISFREARASMRFDADRFRVFDTDNDGRLTFQEFTEFIRSERALGREVSPPVAARPDGEPPVRDAEQLRAAYDTDLDGSISRLELDRMLLDYDEAGRDFDGAMVIRRLDADGDGLLGITELRRLASYLGPLGGDAAPARAQPGARTVGELFGAPIDMGEALPPRVIGPVPPFRRLDVDNDGYVTLADLERLEGRSFSAVSLKSVLGTLDYDFDGRLSQAEFLTSMTPAARRR